MIRQTHNNTVEPWLVFTNEAVPIIESLYHTEMQFEYNKSLV